MRLEIMPLTCGFSLERVTGIEPALSAWEADVLPLNYTRAAPRLAPTSYRNKRPARPGRQARDGLPIPAWPAALCPASAGRRVTLLGLAGELAQPGTQLGALPLQPR